MKHKYQTGIFVGELIGGLLGAYYGANVLTTGTMPPLNAPQMVVTFAVAILGPLFIGREMRRMSNGPMARAFARINNRVNSYALIASFAASHSIAALYVIHTRGSPDDGVALSWAMLVTAAGLAVAAMQDGRFGWVRGKGA